MKTINRKLVAKNFDPKDEQSQTTKIQDVYMLATSLKSKVATKITIAIMDAFVVMKNIINTSLIE